MLQHQKYKIPITCLGLLILTLMVMLLPIANNQAEAAAADVSLTKQIPSTVTLSISGNDTTNLTPLDTKDGIDTARIDKQITVDLTNSSGYSIQIAADTEDLVGTNNQNTIPALAQGSVATLAQMPANTWGYSLDGKNYQPTPTTSKQIYDSGSIDITSTTTKSHILSFAAKVNGDTPGDTYSNTITVSVVSRPGEVATFAGLTMQQVTPTICKQAAIHETAYLKDERDNNYYWITKLKDGNCWMSQNLALDLTKDVPVEGSIVNTDGTVSAYTYTPEATTLTPADNDRYNNEYWAYDNAFHSWNEGKFVVIKPDGSYIANTSFTAEQGGLGAFSDLSGNTTIPTSSQETSQNGTNIPYDATSPRVTYTVDGVKHDGIVADVTNWTAAEDPNFTNSTTYIQGSNSYGKIAGWSIDPVNKVYDAHYLVGNYYQWMLLVDLHKLGYNYVDDGDVAPISICPTGWQLPTSGETHQGDGSFYNMLKNYGNLATSYDAGITLPGNTAATDNIASSPLFLVRAGYIDANTNKFLVAGRDATLWSSAVATNLNSYVLDINSGRVLPSANYRRARGFSVRCLMKAN